MLVILIVINMSSIAKTTPARGALRQVPSPAAAPAAIKIFLCLFYSLNISLNPSDMLEAT